MTSKEKDGLIRLILDRHVAGRSMALSYIIPVDDRVRMAEAIEVVTELSRKMLVRDVKPTMEDLLFKVNPELATFAQRGGFEAEDIMFQAQVEKAFLEIAKLRSDVKPGLYNKIVKILEPLAKLAGVAADVFWA